MDPVTKKIPKRKDDRIILQFDYDCFYAQVFENKNPSLKTLPVGVKQKNCLATCNYVARGIGLRKLMTVTDAKRACPELVLVDGEDLTPFRDTSKVLFNFFRSFSWNQKVERLGFDEIFMDVTDMVEYNMWCINKASLADGFFCLSKEDPERGFQCDLTSIAGCVEGTASTNVNIENPTYLRLLLASHLAHYLRLQVEEKYGFTSTCGISTNKMLSKLAGSKHKPRNQTTLLTLNDEVATAFIDGHPLQKIPGLGSKIVQLLEAHISRGKPSDEWSPAAPVGIVTARDVRLDPGISSGTLEALLAGPGAERGVGSRIWGLLHGVDHTEVKAASDVPTQISIEDTYPKGLETMAQVTEQLHKLAFSLVRRMRVDLVVPDGNSTSPEPRRWLARPKTLRLSVRSWAQMAEAVGHNFGRVSRSGPLPGLVFDLETDLEQIAERLVIESLLPLLRRLEPEQGHRRNLQMLNLCVANMIVGAAEDKSGAGRDISVMFKRQHEVLRPFQVTADADVLGVEEDMADEESQWAENSDIEEEEQEEVGEKMPWDDDEAFLCSECGNLMPSFALSAHRLYHEMED